MGTLLLQCGRLVHAFSAASAKIVGQHKVASYVPAQTPQTDDFPSGVESKSKCQLALFALSKLYCVSTAARFARNASRRLRQNERSVDFRSRATPTSNREPEPHKQIHLHRLLELCSLPLATMPEWKSARPFHRGCERREHTVSSAQSANGPEAVAAQTELYRTGTALSGSDLEKTRTGILRSFSSSLTRRST
jgi:hypothetical protein